MKNISNFQSGLTAAVITVGLILGGASVFAADNDNVIIEGTVSPVNEIVVTPVEGHNALDMAAGAVNQQVATVNEKNNDPDGYTVTLTTLNAPAGNAAFLKGSDADNSQTFAYSMKYGTAGSEADVTLASGSAVVTSTSAASIEAGAEKSLLVSFTGSSWKNADTYSDTITLTIAAK